MVVKMKEKTIELLKALGFNVGTDDEVLLDFFCHQTENEICDYCNIKVIPDALFECAVENVCGKFLHAQLAIGNIEQISTSKPLVKAVAVGDINVSFADGEQSDFDKILSLANRLLISGKERWICYRRLSW